MGTIVISILAIVGASMALAILLRLVIKNVKSVTNRDKNVVGTMLAIEVGLTLIVGFSMVLIQPIIKKDIPEGYTPIYYSIDKTRTLIDAIAEVESLNDPTATNPHSTASGHLQILKVLVDEANRLCGYDRYTYADRFSIDKSEEIFIIIQNKYNPQNDIEKAIRIWNGGPKYTKEATEEYYKKVMRVYNRMIDEQLNKVVREVKTLHL